MKICRIWQLVKYNKVKQGRFDDTNKINKKAGKKSFWIFLDRSLKVKVNTHTNLSLYYLTTVPKPSIPNRTL